MNNPNDEKKKLITKIIEGYNQHKKDLEKAIKETEKIIENKNKYQLDTFKRLNKHAGDIFMLFYKNECTINTGWWSLKRPKPIGCKRIKIIEHGGHDCRVKILPPKLKGTYCLRDDYPDNEFYIVWESYEYDNRTSEPAFIVPDRYYSMTIQEIVDEWNEEYEKMEKAKKVTELKKRREEYEKLKEEFDEK